ncbi:hypothetical protein LguiA_012864 [Lonicera macranthoides]
MSSDNCSSRHFKWITKSCFPNNQNQQNSNLHHPCPASTFHRRTATTISSLPDDILLECLSRVPPSSLPSLSLVCRRWSLLLDSPSFHHLRRRLGLLHPSVFALSLNISGLCASILQLDHDGGSWRTTSFPFFPDDVVSQGCFHNLFSHARVAAIGRQVYIIGRNAMLRCDTWTGAVTPKPAMLFPRKNFAASVVAGKIYVAGGSARTPAVEEYDPESNAWCVVANAPRKRYGCIGACVDGVFYIVGGLKIGITENEQPRASRASGAEAHVYASSMDLYDVEEGVWLRSRAMPGGGCVVAACAAGGHLFMLASHAVELSFWMFNGRRQGGGGGFGEWCRLKSPPLPAQVRLDSRVRFSCVGIGEKVVLIQVGGCIDDLLRRSGRGIRGLKEGLVLVYDSAAGEWSRGVDLPELSRRAACICVEC